MCVKKLQQSGMRSFGVSRAAMLALLSATLLTGCEPNAGGLGGAGGGVPPDLCTLNLDIGLTNIDTDPNAAGLQMGDPLADDAFRLSWSYLYVGHHDWDGIHVGPYPFVTRVRLWKNGELVFEIEFDGEVKPGDFESDEIIFDDGLPAGDYDGEIVVDTEGTVPECEGLPEALDNVRNFQFSVEPHPIDDLQENDGGNAEDRQPVASF